MTAGCVGPRMLARVLGVAAAIAWATTSWAQGSPAPAHSASPDPNRTVADVRPGDGTLLVRVVHPDGAAKAMGLDLALYALQPDGTPGLRDGRTNAEGQFSFEGISSEPGVVYLVGARYQEIPFGKRVSFAEGETRAEVEISISDPLKDPSAIRVRESELRLESLGSQLIVQETHRLHNGSDRVVFVPVGARQGAPPAFEAQLPEGADGFFPGSTLFDESTELDGDRVLHWGPVYPGDSEVRFRYTLDGADAAPGDDRELVQIREAVPAGAARVVVLVPEGGLQAHFEALTAAGEIELEGRNYARLEAVGWAPGRRLEGTVSLPVSSRDRALLSIPRVDCWVELDGAAITVSQEVHFKVAGESQLVADTAEPLLVVPLPEGAEFLGVSQESSAMGAGPAPQGGIALAGPLPPGESRIALRYRVPTVSPGGATGSSRAELALHFEAPVEVLNVLVADTGIAVQDDRLHRRRPFRSGTRTYLHREGFQIDAGETVSMSFQALSRSSWPPWTSLGLVALAALGAVALVFRPLGSAPGPDAPLAPDLERLATERAALYGSIRDLDHDFETGKVAESDYRGMRHELRAQAVDLLREERSRAERSRADQAEQPPETLAAVAGEAASADAVCPACGEPVSAAWSFCSGCGKTLARQAGE